MQLRRMTKGDGCAGLFPIKRAATQFAASSPPPRQIAHDVMRAASRPPITNASARFLVQNQTAGFSVRASGRGCPMGCGRQTSWTTASAPCGQKVLMFKVHYQVRSHTAHIIPLTEPGYSIAPIQPRIICLRKYSCWIFRTISVSAMELPTIPCSSRRYAQFS